MRKYPIRFQSTYLQNLYEVMRKEPPKNHFDAYYAPYRRGFSRPTAPLLVANRKSYRAAAFLAGRDNALEKAGKPIPVGLFEEFRDPTRLPVTYQHHPDPPTTIQGALYPAALEAAHRASNAPRIVQAAHDLALRAPSLSLLMHEALVLINARRKIEPGFIPYVDEYPTPATGKSRVRRPAGQAKGAIPSSFVMYDKELISVLNDMYKVFANRPTALEAALRHLADHEEGKTQPPDTEFGDLL